MEGKKMANLMRALLQLLRIATHLARRPQSSTFLYIPNILLVHHPTRFSSSFVSLILHIMSPYQRILICRFNCKWVKFHQVGGSK